MNPLPTFEYLLLEEDEGVLICTINRPKVYNALNLEVWHELVLFAQYFASEDRIKAAVLTGAGPKAFAAGADLNCIQYLTMPEGIKKNELCLAEEIWGACPKPIIAAVNGMALGGGMELALSCDTRIASENALFGLPEPTLGVIPGAGGTQRLSRMCGVAVAKDMMLFGRQLNAHEAYNANLVMKVVPEGQALAEAVKIAKKTITKRSPMALGLCKAVIDNGSQTDLKTALYIENMVFGLTMGTKNKAEGVAAFLEKRSPIFPEE